MIWGADGSTYAALEQLASDREAVLQVIKHAEVWLRDVILLQSGMEAQVVHAERMQDVQRLAEAFDVWRVGETLAQLESLREMNMRNVNLQLSLMSLWRCVKEYAV